MKRTPLQYRFTSPAGMPRFASCNASNGDFGQQYRSRSDNFTGHADTASVTDFPHPVSPQNRHQFNCIAALDERLPTPYIGEKYWRSSLIRPIKNVKACCDMGIAACPAFCTSPNNDSVNMTRAHNNKDSV